jgi:hypothetical protein
LAVLSAVVACGKTAVSDHMGAQARRTGVVDMGKATDFAWILLHQPKVTPFTCNPAPKFDHGGT